MMAWNAFSQTLAKVSSSLITNSHLISKVYFPRLILPLAPVASPLIDSRAVDCRQHSGFEACKW